VTSVIRYEPCSVSYEQNIWFSFFDSSTLYSVLSFLCGERITSVLPEMPTGFDLRGWFNPLLVAAPCLVQLWRFSCCGSIWFPENSLFVLLLRVGRKVRFASIMWSDSRVKIFVRQDFTSRLSQLGRVFCSLWAPAGIGSCIFFSLFSSCDEKTRSLFLPAARFLVEVEWSVFCFGPRLLCSESCVLARQWKHHRGWLRFQVWTLIPVICFLTAWCEILGWSGVICFLSSDQGCCVLNRAFLLGSGNITEAGFVSKSEPWFPWFAFWPYILFLSYACCPKFLPWFPLLSSRGKAPALLRLDGNLACFAHRGIGVIFLQEHRFFLFLV
jgi:hypothetical protein